MIDCLDKQQQHQQQQQQVRQDPVFWSQSQQPLLQQQQIQFPSTLSYGGGTAHMNSQQQHQDQKKHQLLVDIEPSGQLDELEASSTVQQQQQQQGASNDLIGYYFGSISRETAEWILKTHGNRLDGAYLLRSSGPKDDFVLSLMVVHGTKNAGDVQDNGQRHSVASIATAAGAAAITSSSSSSSSQLAVGDSQLEVLHYKIVETDDSFVALHGQVGDEKFATIDELIEKAQGVATKPKWPIQRQSLESQILPPTFWGLTVDQIRLAILIKAKQWGFPLSIFQQPTMLSTNQTTMMNDQHQSASNGSSITGGQQMLTEGGESVSAAAALSSSTVTTLDNETIRTLIYKSLHEFQPWFHGRISRDEAERRIEEGGHQRDGSFLVRERDNFSYAMCISHKRTTKHYRIDVLSTGELAIQDGRKFTSLMALVSHYTIMSDGLWCALTEPCPRPIQQANKFHASQKQQLQSNHNNFQPGINQSGQRFFSQNFCGQPASNQFGASMNQLNSNNNIYCVPPPSDNRDTTNTTTSGSFVTSNAPCHMSAAMENGGLSSSAASSSLGVQHRSLANANCKMNKQQQTPASSYSHLTRQGNPQAQIMCPGNQSNNQAVLSIKAPIKDWLHTINHKWSQLIASRTNQQHQSLNSFLFGPSNPLNNHCRHRNHHHHHQHHHNHHRRRCKNTCPRHSQQQDLQNALTHTNQRQAKGVNQASKNIISQQQLQQQQQSQAPFMMNGNCNCCSLGAQSMVSGDGVHSQVGTMIHNRLAQGTGAGGPCGSLRSLPANNMVMQTNNGLASLGGASSTATQMDPTKVLLSCLPQNSGFMLDSSQSFIGSPLFVVKATNNNNNPTAAANIDAARAGHTNGVGADTGSGGSNNSGGGVGTNVEKLISPAQSISTNLNGHQQQQSSSNPYALNTDIYGSQTSTAIVHDHLLTSSSSSSGNTAHHQAQHNQASIDTLKHYPNQFRRPITGPAVAHNPPATNIRYGTTPSGGGRFVSPAANIPGARQLKSTSQQQADTGQQVQPLTAAAAASRPRWQPTARIVPPIQHAGQILCGQHAGPAYRYTNCTGNEDSTFRPCVHSASLGMNNANAIRAVDDLHLPSASTQLAGPAALTKFVQFQDGQCLRTHRDTRSIQMAYLLSRQEALNVLNNRGPMGGGGSSRLSYNPSSANQPTQLARQQQQQTGGYPTGQSIDSRFRPPNEMRNNFGTLNGAGVSGDLANSIQDDHLRSTGQQQQQQQQADFDLIDCDGSGFQFKYDPKLIKSSSIETLCGAGDNDDDDNNIIEDLSNFKTNSELLMSLQPCWSTSINQGSTTIDNIDIGFSPLIPITASDLESKQQQTNHQSAIDLATTNGQVQMEENQQQDQADNESRLASSLLFCGDSAPVQYNEQNEHQANENNWTRKHNLDELTTSLLAELTASLKAQVDLKNKRSGLCTSSLATTNELQETSKQQYNQDRCNNNQTIDQREQSQTEANGLGQNLIGRDPLELINEFDTLIKNNR
uniref:Tyrosine-protein kinase SYK n=1 Tax=Aceria tosichella TaxID=561515 RepID=A0A6G1SN22_9ACAR